MTLQEFETELVNIILDAVSGGYFRNPEEDDEGYNYDDLQALIEQKCDEVKFDVFDNGTSYRQLADKYEDLIL